MTVLIFLCAKQKMFFSNMFSGRKFVPSFYSVNKPEKSLHSWQAITIILTNFLFLFLEPIDSKP